MLALALMLSVSPITAFAHGDGAGEPQARGATEDIDSRAFTRYELGVSRVYNKSIYAYSQVPVSHNGAILSVDARLINGEAYVSVRHLAEHLGYRVTYRSAERTLNVRGVGLDMDVIDGGNVVWANGRVLFSMTPSVLMSNGRMYAPLASVSKAFGLGYSLTGSGAELTGAPSPIKSGASFYREDAVYWLSRIISAESRGESLEGKIAVGNVVLNRVKSAEFPNTIYNVIFDNRWGGQFEPVRNGTIYQTPTEESILAAKLCLTGANVIGDSLYFIAPALAQNFWTVENCEYVATIGCHDFYR